MKKKFWNFAVVLLALLFATHTSQGQFKNKTSVHDNHVNLASKNQDIFGFIEMLHNPCPVDSEMVTPEKTAGITKDDYNDFFAGGTGTEQDPWLIETAEHLNNIRMVLSMEFKSYKQIADINLGVAPWNEEEGWAPIVGMNNRFRGTYNGNGFVIDQLTINRPDSDFCGLFGQVYNSLLQNIQITNANIHSHSKSGVLAGIISSSIIENSSTTGNIISSGHRTGGIVGEITYGEVRRSYSYVDIESVGNSVGGLCGGLSTGGVIKNSYANGNITGSTTVGGLVGWVFQQTQVLNSYATGYVSATGRAGGLIGGGYDSSSITNSYWNIETSTQTTSLGGEGKTTAELISEDTFLSWDFESSWAIIEGETYPYLQWQGGPDEFNYPIFLLPPFFLFVETGDGAVSIQWLPPSIGEHIGFNLYRDGELIQVLDAETHGYIDTNVENFLYYTYSLTAFYYDNQESNPIIIRVFPTPGFSHGDGTEENPYQVSNAGELFTIRSDLSAHYTQTADIDLGVAPWNLDEGWKPITDLLNAAFRGHYNGNDYTISGLTINRPEESFQGLFRDFIDATITNINISNSHINANQYAGILGGRVADSHFSNISISNSSVTAQSIAGGLVSYVNDSSLENIKCLVDVSTVDSYAGGIVGWLLWESTLIQSMSSGNVFAGNYAGGLVGRVVNNPLISNSYSNANVSVEHEMAGGLVGYLSRSQIYNSYATGHVNGNKAGGLIGCIELHNGSPSTIINNYSTGTVNEGIETGGLVGSILQLGTNPVSDFQNNYWDIQSSRQEESALGEGLTTAEMLVQSNFENWDFAETWSNIETVTYPFLLWQGEPGDHNFPLIGHQVTFRLNMGNAEDFNPDNDVVYISGSMFEWAVPGSDPGNQTMSRVDDSMIWEKFLTIPTGVNQYKYFLNEGWNGAEWTDAPYRDITIMQDTIIENTWGVPEGGTFIDSSESVFTQLFPNPADGFINIQTNSVINRIRIIDVTGRIVFMRQYDHSAVQIPVNSFEAGLYVVQIYTLEGLMTRKLMIK